MIRTIFSSPVDNTDPVLVRGQADFADFVVFQALSYFSVEVTKEGRLGAISLLKLAAYHYQKGQDEQQLLQMVSEACGFPTAQGIREKHWDFAQKLLSGEKQLWREDEDK